MIFNHLFCCKTNVLSVMHTYICTGIENYCQFVCHSCDELLLLIRLSTWETCSPVISRDTVVTMHQRTILIIFALDFDIFKHAWSYCRLSGYRMLFFSLLKNRKSRSVGNWCFSLSHVTWEVLNIWRSHLSPGTKSCNTTYCLHWSKDSPSGHSFLFFDGQLFALQLHLHFQ